MTKVFRLKVLGADRGDCLWVEYGPEESPYRILVDGGPRSTFKRLKPLLEEVRGDTPSHELLVVTHIDDDHIAGCLEVLKDPDLAAQFEHIWFNGYADLLPPQDGAEEAFGPVQGEKLTAAIRACELPWNEHFSPLPVALDRKGRPMEIQLNGGAVVTVLSPTLESLAKLEPVWASVVQRAGLVPGMAAEQEAQEQVIEDDEEALGGIDVESLANARTGEDKSEANGSSIALLITYEGKSMLLGADAHPSVLLSGIRAYAKDLPLKVDLFKLPHHGSRANVTTELLDAVDTGVVVFSSNGDQHSHPNPEAVARVVKRYEGGVELCFNYLGKFTSDWNDATLRDRWGYKVRYGKDDKGLTLDLLP